MDERLPLGSLDAATLAMLLEKERTQRHALEQEVRRLQAGAASRHPLWADEGSWCRGGACGASVVIVTGHGMPGLIFTRLWVRC